MRRRAGPGGLRRAGRLRELLVAGVVDSFGMALGWTVLVLLAVSRGGLAEAALYHAAMLVGVVLSAPVTGWLARRASGRALLRGAAGSEMLLRVGVLAGLIAGLPSGVIAAAVLILNVAAWTGFAGMRAEVAAVAPGARPMTRYALSIAAVEAAGTGLGALLPVGPDGHPTGVLLVAVFVLYAGTLVPTLVAARRARVTPHRTDGARPRGRSSRRPAVSPVLLLAGGGIMLLASGPTLLAVPLTTELHGRAWVAGTAVAFSLGCLLATGAVAALGRVGLPAVLRWSLWGMGMLAGWIAAPLHVFSVLFAQFLAGLSQTALEGDMDARAAAEAPPDGVTTALAYSASVRALGGSIAVKALPVLVAAPAIGTAASGAVAALGVAVLTVWALRYLPRPAGRTAPG
ncbi:hypothetical protein [Jidongwangia harbinensis]|uniref:hypothetical protein n=1 Tax=Jidongwangia harbinensis TaxID=2878561 RepID=UPI001CDA1A14|nr:hypothetical protein [Jidongwangia harbinensis]MCA2216501.1 hypothetical protein [Jidongwangia harbinensis]